MTARVTFRCVDLIGRRRKAFRPIFQPRDSAGEIYRTETHLVEKPPLIRTLKFDKILLQEMLPFFLKLNSILETFVDKSRPGKYYRNVYRSDYHDDVDILTCEDMHVNDKFTACSVDVIFFVPCESIILSHYNK